MSASKVTTRLETITPNKAAEWLENAGPNRPVSEPHAVRLASAMTAGEWEVNGETLKFDSDNQLIDGRHRCRAVLLSNVTIKSFVIRGLNSCTFDTIDGGKRRDLGAIFAKHGESNYRILAGAAAWVWRHDRGYIASGRTTSPRIPEGVAVLKENPTLRDSCRIENGCRHLIAPSMAVALHYLFSQKDEDAADFFFEKLSSGEDLSRSSTKTSGIYYLRKQLEDNRASRAKLPPNYLWALTVKAWNAMREGRVVKMLRHRTGGERPEDFPAIK